MSAKTDKTARELVEGIPEGERTERRWIERDLLHEIIRDLAPSGRRAILARFKAQRVAFERASTPGHATFYRRYLEVEALAEELFGGRE